MTLVVGEEAHRRRTSSGPVGPSRPRPTTTTSGRVRAVDSTARNASDVTSIWRSGAAWSMWYCKRATSSAESKSRTVAICWGYRPTLSQVERATSGGRTAQPQARSVHDAGADRDGNRLGPVVGAQLLEDALEMGLDRVGGDPELGSDLAGGRPVGHLLEDLALAFGQRRGLRLVADRLGLLDERLRELWVDHRVALDGVPCGVDERIGGGILEQVARY